MSAKFVNKTAPDFSLEDQDGKAHKLNDYRGKKVLLYFYPKDMTSGCTVEAQCFRDNIGDLEKFGVKVFGISCDDVKSHRKFVDAHDLNFDLLADVDKEVVNSYGVWVEKSMYGRKYMGISRESFLIDEDGVIVKHYEKVKPATHVADVLADLGEMD